MSATKKLAPNETVQRQAFEALAAVFTKYEPQEPGNTDPHPAIEIEILSDEAQVPHEQFILEDEGERAIGVPKKVLIAAFLHARALFMATAASERESKEIDSAIKILLLYDPEFLTAANARKQLLLSLLSMREVYGPMHKMMLSFAVHKELWFLTSVLTSPLHRQSKSPTLWFHHAWLYQTFMTECEFMFATRGYLLRELDVILKSAERHQHNYYAFGFARRVLRPALNVVHKRETNAVDGNEMLNWKTVLERVVQWCKAHPADTSGWSFLGYWMDWQVDKDQASRQAVQAVLKFALNLKWTGEALWSFLRTLASRAVPDDKLALRIRNSMEELCPRLVHEAMPTGA